MSALAESGVAARQIVVAGIAFLGLVVAEARADDFIEWSPRIEAVNGFAEAGQQVRSEVALTLEAQSSPADWLDMTAIARLRWDFADEMEPGRPSQANRAHMSRRLLIDNRGELELREFYGDVAVGDAIVRIGKQQIVWGQADGLKVLDVVNPQSFRYFILDAFDQSRIPLWSVNAEIPYDDFLVSLIWVPDRSYSDVPEFGATFAPSSPMLVLPPTPGKSFTLNDPSRPDDIVGDSDAGFAVSAFLGGWDLSLNYLYHYNDLPALRYLETATAVTVDREFVRSHLIGGSFAKAFEEFSLRGELGYFSRRPFTVARDLVSSGTTNSDEVSLVLGLDWNGIANTFISAQVFESYLPDYRRAMIRDRFETISTLICRYTFNEDLTRVQVKHLHGVNLSDGFVEAALRHEFTDQITGSLKGVAFYGDRAGLFGQYDSAEHISLEIEVGF